MRAILTGRGPRCGKTFISNDGSFKARAPRREFVKIFGTMSVSDSELFLPFGTQVFAPQYGFTNAPRRVEAARRVLEMGSSILKCALRVEACDGASSDEAKSLREGTLCDLARRFEVVRELLDMPFAHAFLWAYPHGGGSWSRVPSDEELDVEFRELMELGVYLLERYAGSGRTFYFGNWEGDWHATPPGTDAKLTDAMADGLVRRLGVRQRAVDALRSLGRDRGVGFYHYLELNRVRDAMESGERRLVNSVLPHVEIDLVSYSAYDSINAFAPVRLRESLDYIEGQMRPRAEIEAKFGRRVFLGEYGYPAARFSELAMDARAREVMKIALQWGCPFVLYWEMYNNERDEAGGQIGYWLIDDKNKKTPLYETHRALCAFARSQDASWHGSRRERRTADLIGVMDRMGNDHDAAAGAVGEPKERIQRAWLDGGNASNFSRLKRRMELGESITIGGLGGSITQGAGASRVEHRYLERVADWLRQKSKGSAVRVVNAGIGATSSLYGCLRAQRDLLSADPDVVILDYGVNDGPELSMARTYEGCVRQILDRDDPPAVLSVFFMHRDGRNAESTHASIARHYGIPVVSYREAFWPEIEADRMVWEEISHDDVHPNDRGHRAAADFIAYAIESTLQQSLAGAVHGSRSMPAPLHSARWQRVNLFEAKDLFPVSNDGWHLEPDGGAWTSDRPGATIAFEITGSAITLMWYCLRADMGRVEVSIDGRSVGVFDGWFAGTWGGYRNSWILDETLDGRMHRVVIRLIQDRNSESGGHRFRVLGLGAAC